MNALKGDNNNGLHKSVNYKDVTNRPVKSPP